MEGDSRRISVYDLTGLRVHPDGFRVHQSQQNLRLGTHQRHIAQDSRGWVADDAGGSVIMPKYGRYPQTSSPDAENLEALVTAENEPGESVEEIASSAKGKRKDTSNIRRALKRKKFAEDDNYISSLSRTHETSPRIPQIPSQDLLKNIHHLAASYYDKNGLLINASKRYRKAKKLRKLRRHEVSSEPASAGARTNEDDEMSDTEQIAAEDNSVELQKKVNRDMYRVLDGSVLVAIGIFTEEIVKKLLQGRERVTRRQVEVASSDDEASGRSNDDITSATSGERSDFDN